ncbi:cell division control protein [Pyrococcus sp. NA2]|nr:cell division control protein [Pyrococcus sp. NA2]
MGKIKDLLTITPKKSIAINWMHLNSYDPELANEVLENPEECILAAEDAIQIILKEDFLREDFPRVHARFHNLPKTLMVKEIGAEHINKLIQVEGVVTRVTEIKPFVSVAVFVCKDCGYEMVVPQRPYEGFVSVKKCEQCGSKNVQLDVEKSKFVNFQMFRIQDRPETLRGGQMPRFIDGILLDDIVDTAMPGDRVIVVGILRVIQEKREKVPTFKKVIEVNHIEPVSKELEELEISPEEEQKIRELAKRKDIVSAIVDSIAPAIYGYKEVKKGIALALFGGVSRTLPDGTRLRGDIHVLLVGDPGVAKCVDYETEVILGDGSRKKIGEIVEKAIKKAEKEGRLQRIDDGFYAPIDLEVYALDSRTLKIRKVKANIAWKRTAPERMLKIRTKKGREIKVTPTHPFFTFEDGTFKTRKATELRIGDKIATPREDNDPVNIPETCDEELEELLLNSDIFWDEVVEIEEYKPKNPWVYDLQVPEHHNFIANDLIVHNSQLLRYVANLAPRAIYTSGKSSSAAGLCVAPDTKVLTDKGEREIGKLVEEWMREVGEIKYKMGISFAPYLGKVRTFKGGKVICSPASRVWKLRAPEKLVKVTTESGRSIALTSETKLLTLENGEYSWIEAGNIRPGAYVGTLTGEKIIPRIRKTIVELANLYGIDVNLEEVKETLESIQKADISKMRVPGREETYEELLKKLENAKGKEKNELLIILSDASDVHEIVKEKVMKIKEIIESDIGWERVTKVELVDSPEYVYDLTVEGSHNFIANGFIVHNTAAVVRDEFTGGWVLEAGALVLADGGYALIDELDKMSDRDRSVIHEALEQQTISLSKAGITATLNARTTVIAAANPKHGRFNKMKRISEQIDLPPTLLSRFDLIFVLMDEPDEKLDSEIARHILRVRRGESEVVTPKIPHDLLRKYIAYARKNVHPVISEEAMEEIQKYYVKMRKSAKKSSEDEIKPIPITARQLEALIRLSEAHARMRLSPIVTREDAREAIKLMEYTLRQIAVDEAGQLDVTILEVGQSARKLSKVEKILDIIKKLERTSERGAKVEDILEEAMKVGIDKNEAREILEKLLIGGQIYMPETGYYRTV